MGYLLRIALIALAVWLVVRYLRKRFSAPAPPAPSDSRHEAVDRMRACDYCGVYLPQSELIRQNEKVYCCREHRDADREG